MTGQRAAKTVILGVAGLVAGVTLAHAAALTGEDSRYLDATYGPPVRQEIVSQMTPDEQSQLHAVINDPFAKEYPGIRSARVADYLFVVHMQQCQAWSAGHPDQVCPPPADLSVIPGKNVADQMCNACHLFGTSQAPSFRMMAKSGGISEAKLAGAIKQGHRMSPIDLSPAQINALVAYIDGLK